MFPFCGFLGKSNLILKGGFHGLVQVCIIYSPVHTFWHRPSFSLFMNQIIVVE